MGGITSVASAAVQTLGAVNSYQNNSGVREARQTKEKLNLENQQIQQKSILEKEQLNLKSQEDEKQRQRSLRAAIARRKASLGGQGVGSSDGSGNAVLLGIYDETEEERSDRQKTDNLRTKIIDTELDQKRRVNTLQLAQLKEKNRINKYTSAWDSIGSLL